ncbi:hypothetical protein P154DRAFT_598842 [Amniculicola lignicola CBS 123094]|uniref:Uncharacterized protein n=1 Tax=Amniculicola lignicola CBS 123094 TaxID=1392246 RepID=A0A6A5WHW3_9PLEO|nr:hypothetical protein P154DRAFT_598842 [Amniculicola lignicola CBS 123094]
MTTVEARLAERNLRNSYKSEIIALATVIYGAMAFDTFDVITMPEDQGDDTTTYFGVLIVFTSPPGTFTKWQVLVEGDPSRTPEDALERLLDEMHRAFAAMMYLQAKTTNSLRDNCNLHKLQPTTYNLHNLQSPQRPTSTMSSPPPPPPTQLELLRRYRLDIILLARNKYSALRFCGTFELITLVHPDGNYEAQVVRFPHPQRPDSQYLVLEAGPLMPDLCIAVEGLRGILVRAAVMSTEARRRPPPMFEEREESVSPPRPRIPEADDQNVGPPERTEEGTVL